MTRFIIVKFNQPKYGSATTTRQLSQLYMTIFAKFLITIIRCLHKQRLKLNYFLLDSKNWILKHALQTDK